jgi:hypothetical protein
MTPELVVAKFSVMFKKPVGALTNVPLRIEEGTDPAVVGMKPDTPISLAEWSNVEALRGKPLPDTLNGLPK